MKKVILLIATVLIGLTTYAQQTGSPIWTPILEEHPTTVDIQLTNASESHLQVHVQVPGFFTTTVNTDRGEAQVISLPKTPNNYTAGEPDLPYLVIPSIIDDQAQMGIEILASKFQDFENVEVAPSKGDISRQVDPVTVPYPYGACYQRNAFIPDQQADLFEPYILRDFRGQNMVVKPFAYNPVTKTLRVYYDLTVAMKATGKSGENVLNRKRQEMTMDPEFEALYSSKFINYQEVKNRYNPIGENGELLIICYESFMNAMEPFVTWKRTIGRPTEIVGTSVTGTSASSIQSYITSYYNSHPNLTHVLFVSDCDHIPGVNMSGFDDYSGYSDQRYGQIVGNDYYNDIFIGRFSANNVSQVTTQVNRTITYERDLNTSATWLKKGMGVSKKENGSGHNGEDDYEHIDLIRTDLLGYNYTTVYQEYAGVSGISSTTTTISNNINSGVGIINYCNHGSVTSWQSHNYSNTHVNSLTNNNKLPFIISTACLNGKYDNSGDCFAEAWMHATNNSTSAPTGAIGGIFSYISQPWIPPMEGQDEMNDILVESYMSNKSSQYIEFGDIGLPMPWNNKYASTSDTYSNRLTVHSFAGADSGYGYAIRCSGEGNYMLFTPVVETGARVEYVDHWVGTGNGTSEYRSGSLYTNWLADSGGWFPGLSVFYIHSKNIRTQTGRGYFTDDSSLILAPGEEKSYSFKFSAVRAGDGQPGQSASSEQNASASNEEREKNFRSILYKEGMIDAVAVPSFQTAINMDTLIDLHYDENLIDDVRVNILCVHENDPYDREHIPTQRRGRCGSC